MKNLLILLLLSFHTLCALAQPGTNDSTFNLIDPGYSNGLGPDDQIRSVALQNDGKVLIGGYFTQFNEKTIKRIARIHDGVPDTSFKTGNGFNDYVQCIVLQSDGKILVGGDFTSYNGVTRNRIARLNTDGSLDMSFNPGNGPNSLVRSIAIQSDGKIVIAGNFTTYSGTGRSRIARLNSNGSLDNSYDPGSGFNSAVYSIGIQANDKIVAVGAFTLFDGTTRERVARLETDGTLDLSFLPGFGFDKTAYSLALAPNGNIVVGGDFDYFNGTARNRIAVIDSGGTLAGSFNPGSGFNSSVYSLRVQADGKILAGGSFSSYDGNTANKIIRLEATGNEDSGFHAGSGFGGSGGNVVYSIQVHPDGRIVAGGIFPSYNGQSRNNVVRLFSDGTPDYSLNRYTGFSGKVRSIVVQKDGKILAGGDFRFYNGVERSGIARLNSDGTLDTGFAVGTGINYNIAYTGVHSLLLQDDGKILVGGDFFDYNGSTVSGLIRLHPDGTLDTTFKTGTGVGAGSIYHMALQSDGKIIIGGSFNSYGGSISYKIARIHTDGSRDTSFNTGVFPYSGFDQDVKALVIQPDGKILVGGGFSRYRNTFVSNRILRLNPDGSLDPNFLQTNGFSGGGVETIGLQADGRIVVGGTFTSFNGTARNKMARVESDGTLDASFYPGSNGFNGTVSELIVQGDGKILAAGTFTQYNLVDYKRIIRLNSNGTVDNGIDFHTGFPDDVETIALQPDGKILAGGVFTSFDGYGRNRIARINNTCVPNLIVIGASACDSFVFNNQTYKASGIYQQQFTNAYGCDSTIQLNLTVHASSGSNLIITACDTFAFLGQQYTSSGIYTHVIPNSVGCDSTITLDLTINNSTSQSITTSACSSYILNGQTYTASGTYVQMMTNMAGCDSIITLNLTINDADTGVSRTGPNTLQANAIGAVYQWIDCDNTTTPEIPGATGRTFTATQNGRYAVRVTENSCTGTSACHTINSVGIEDPLIPKVALYPNPAGSTVTLVSEAPLNGADIRLRTMDGRLIGEETAVEGSVHTLDLTRLAPGIYLVEITQQHSVLRIKLVKE